MLIVNASASEPFGAAAPKEYSRLKRGRVHESKTKILRVSLDSAAELRTS